MSIGSDKFKLSWANNIDGAVKRRGRIIGRWLILGIRVYQLTWKMFFPPSCRFHPSCSEYAVSALDRFGPLKGGWLAIRRLLRCHPFHPGGYDPLP